MNNNAKAPRSLTFLERKLLLGFMDELADYFSNASCNDHSLPNDPANRLLMERVIKHDGEEEPTLEDCVQGKKILTSDFLILRYLMACVERLPLQDEDGACQP